MTELGKHGKRMGFAHPRDLRKTDPVPERPTPAAEPKRRVAKPHGYAYEHTGLMSRLFGGKTHEQWFATEKARDQSMKAALRTRRTRGSSTTTSGG